MAATADNITSNNPILSSKSTSIPAIALQITRKNGDRFLEACGVLKDCLHQIQQSDKHVNSSLHDKIFAALSTEKCSSHPMISQFLERLQTSRLSEKEKKAAMLIFYESDKATKLGQLFTILADENFKLLSRSGLRSLFRSVLTAITISLQTTNHMQENSEKGVIVEGQPSKSTSPERPTKRSKLHHSDGGTVTTADETEEDESRIPCQSPSWDSSLATLREEDDHSGIQKEIEDISIYATNDILNFVSKSNNSSSDDKPPNSNANIDFSAFSNWYNKEGDKIVPWIELLQLSKWNANRTNSVKSSPTNDETHKEISPGSLTVEGDKSRTVVSFDFTSVGSATRMVVEISEDNLVALQELVYRTQLIQRSASDVCKLLLQAGTSRTASNGKEVIALRKEDFRRVLRSIIPDYAYLQLKPDEQKSFDRSFDDFFFWFEDGKYGLNEGEVSLQEFAVGFSFFCAGNKSTKLCTGFELLDSRNRGYLTEDQLLRYLHSYLTMLVGLSLLRPVNKMQTKKPVTLEKRKTMRAAIENGAKWTLGHFLRASGQTKNEYTFENFAAWYSKGGYNTAPWLELLDLRKVMQLIGESGNSPLELPPLETSRVLQTTERRPRVRDRVSSLRRHHLSKSNLPPEVLFTFPLGNRRSLVVLKDDATYVRAVVEKLGLLSMKPDDLWSALSSAVEKRRPQSSSSEVAIYINMDTFVQSMQDIIPSASRKRRNPDSSIHQISSTVDELLANFFLCFDIDQCDSVALDELMGGLTLLCGGKKSHKLAFAFSIFDTRPNVSGRGKKQSDVHSLSGEDLFLFLRSILIVTFSTCRQSLDLTDEMVSNCIADTANLICNDVMRHQWETKRLDRLNFDEFGQWYNDGGYERAPWLELLDLRKWVLIDDPLPLPNTQQIHRHKEVNSPGSAQYHRKPPAAAHPTRELPILPSNPSIPPLPPDDSLDANFFDTDALLPMDSMDEMDMILLQPSTDKDDFPKISKSFSFSPRQNQVLSVETRVNRNPLKFHLNTTDVHGGFMLSLSQTRIKSFRHLLENCGLNQISAETACNQIISRGSGTKITKNEFDEAVRSMLTPLFDHDGHTEQLIKDLFTGIFSAFDRECKNEASALEVACGFTVLCRGKKSDKLEFAFEVLDKNKRGRLSNNDMASYLQSFLSVLLSIAFSPALENDPIDDTVATMSGWRCDRTTSTLIQAAKAGADWAASLAFRDFERNHKKATAMSFDDFADWYTSVGFSSIPWLELLDLQKWAITSETK